MCSFFFSVTFGIVIMQTNELSSPIQSVQGIAFKGNFCLRISNKAAKELKEASVGDVVIYMENPYLNVNSITSEVAKILSKCCIPCN